MIFHDVSKTYNPKKDWGRIHVYTGEGKGKTTAALGLAMRALGHGFSVLVIQFLKHHKDFGEWKIQEMFDEQLSFQVVQFGQPGIIDLTNPSAVDRYLATQGLDYARTSLQQQTKRPDLLVLDEVNVLLHYGILPEQEILDFLDNKPHTTEVVLTGRYAPDSVVSKAHLVTEMNPVRHYFDHDFVARQGIEF